MYPSGPTDHSNPKVRILRKGPKGVNHLEGCLLEVVHGVVVWKRTRRDSWVGSVKADVRTAVV
jgi:hypothetical protein